VSKLKIYEKVLLTKYFIIVVWVIFISFLSD
jgi:hypothetical protein